uniref:Uncharacterized protein n=1 Tax=Tanacetum cinerariifolium TaxID=118510 RepID=A0A699J3U0_TANCI|nr:hypothetical protein [Tanacetum cinerariifolium]
MVYTNINSMDSLNIFVDVLACLSQVKEQVKVQVSKILPKIEQTVNEELEAEVLTRSSNSSKTSYRNLYKALVEAYESDKIILDTYGETLMLKRHRDDDADKDEEPSVGSDRGSKRYREGKEPESASAPIEKTTRSAGNILDGFSTTETPTLDRDWNMTFSATHESIQPWISELTKEFDSRSSFNELMDTLVDFFAFLMNRLRVDTLTLELLAGPTYELMKGGHRVIPFDHFINNDLEYLRGVASSHKYTTSITKTKATDYGHIKWIEDLVPRTMWIQEPIGYDKHAPEESPIGGVNISSSTVLLLTGSLLAMYDDKLYKFKEGDFKRLCIQDIEDMLLLLVQGKLTNLTVEERFAFNVSFRMFTRSIVIQRRVEDLQLGVEIYQKKLYLTKPDTYRSDLKRKEAYIAYSNPRGFIYQNKDK